MDMDLIRHAPDLVKPGDHIVLLYEDEREAISPMVSYIYACLRRHERCIYITGGADTQSLMDELGHLLDVGDYLERGQIVVVEGCDAYLRGGAFSPDVMIKMLKAQAQRSIDEGYSATAVTGQICPALQSKIEQDRIVDYEWKLNEQLFACYPISAVCRYNLNQFTSEMIIDVIQTHPLLIWHGQLHENPFYIPPEAYSKQDLSEYQVKSWLRNIGRFNDEKDRFYRAIENQQNKYQELQLKLANEIIISMMSLLGIHDRYTKNHSENVAVVAREVAKSMHLPKDLIAKAYLAGLVHDIGKTLISSDIINKAGVLDSGELEIIRQHPVWAYESLAKAADLSDIATYVLHHHEYWDGRGYPDGLSGGDIPTVSRILSVADAYDAMIQDRPYRRAMSPQDAADEIMSQAGRQFDPFVCRVLLRIQSELVTVYQAKGKRNILSNDINMGK